MKGNLDIAEQVCETKAFWDRFFADHKSSSEAEIAKALGDEQLSYETVFDGDRALGKSSMPFTCLASLYDDQKGFDNNRALAVRVARAFQGSMVSIEVKGAATRAAMAYGLYEYDSALLKDAKRYLGIYE